MIAFQQLMQQYFSFSNVDFQPILCSALFMTLLVPVLDSFHRLSDYLTVLFCSAIFFCFIFYYLVFFLFWCCALWLSCLLLSFERTLNFKRTLISGHRAKHTQNITKHHILASGQCPSLANLHRWSLAMPYRQWMQTTAGHEPQYSTCPLTRLGGGLQPLDGVDNDALNCLEVTATLLGKWHESTFSHYYQSVSLTYNKVSSLA